MPKKPEQFVNELKSLRMKPEAKAAMREHLAAYAELRTTPEATAKTADLSWQVLFMRVGMSFAVLVLVFGVSGAGAIMAARSSLPGDFLYPVKVRVYEPLKLASADTAEEVATVKLAQYEERKRELDVLTSDRRLNMKTQRRLESSVAIAETEAREAAAELAKEDNARAETLLAQLPVKDDPVELDPEPVRVAVANTVTNEVERTVVTPEPEPVVDVAPPVVEPTPSVPTKTITRKSLQQQLDEVATVVSEIETRLAVPADDSVDSAEVDQSSEPERVETKTDDTTTITRTPSGGGGGDGDDVSTDEEVDDVAVVDVQPADPIDDDSATSTATSTDKSATETDDELPADEGEPEESVEPEPTPTVDGASTTVSADSINVVKLDR